MKIAVVVQRYGADINGGAELHARYIAERLARHATVEVFTTCAKDYITWKNELPAGEETVHGVTVRRFPVSWPRNPDDFGRRSNHIFGSAHSMADELKWLDSEGPASRKLIRHIGRVKHEFDFFVFFSARYYHAWHGARAAADKAILVPTAERDAAVGVSIFGPLFRGVRAIMYNSLEERALIQTVTNNREVPGVVVGVGSDIPERVQPWRSKRKFNLKRPYAFYIGRIDENKGCAELFDYFPRYAAMYPDGLDLVLAGSAVLPVPKHPRIKHLGFVSDEDKFDTLAGADFLIMPSPYESLSMVALEAWALGRPVLANGRCDVLRGQAIRSNAGLYYENFEEFAEAMYALEAAGPLNAVLGRNGREFFKRHYAWPVIERKYMEMFERLKKEPAKTSMAPLPGWFARRARNLPPAADAVNAAPKGPVLR
ncbi:MAG: glycosyltransferase family 1 protein [Acidobacteria bacterium]|nr:MAG: glycosyltransferase family 1 protein [Acidobacteriota bacterium]